MQSQLTVRNVDASRDSGRPICEHIEGGEVWSEELILLIGSWPWQQRQEMLSPVHQGGELGTHLLVYHSNKT